MTVSSTTKKTSGQGNASETLFAIGNIAFTDNADLDVWIRDTGESPPTETLKTITTHYFITDSSGNNQVNPGTHIKFNTGSGHSVPAADQQVIVKRKIELTQLTDYASGDAFPADSHESALDRLTLQVQQMQEQIDRAWTYPETYGLAAGQLNNVKMPEPGNNGIIKYNADASAIVLDTDLADATYKIFGANLNDTTAGFLNDKLLAGSGLSKAAVTTATNQTVTLAIDATVATLTGTQTLTNKRLNSPKLNEDVVVSATATELNLLDGVSGLVQADFTKLAAVNASATELNILDGDTGASTVTLADADRIVVNDDGTMKQVALTAFETYFESALDTLSNVTTVGALDAGSITSNFGSINTGSSTITTTGLISGGSLDIDDVLINGSNIGHTDDTDLITVANGLVTVDGEISVTTLDIGGTNVTSSATELNLLDGVSGLAQADFTKLAAVDSTAGELNLLDGSAKSTSSITIADDDAFLVIDGTTSKQIPASDIKTYAGGGGGVGSIDTLFTIQAKSASAPNTGEGNDAVFLGGGTLSNGDVTQHTTAADLIGTEKVFKYDTTGNSVRNYWYHQETINSGYAGKNMVLQLQYYTRNGGDGESFRFVARDGTKPIITVTSDGSNAITGTVDATVDNVAEVGDRIVFKDSSHNIYYRYITSVTNNSGGNGKTATHNVTYGYSGADQTATGKVITGVMTDELDYLPANDTTGNEAKVYRKQMAFTANCTILQFGFHCLDTDTDVELYYDDIALSANQFLQTSSQGQSEGYEVYYQSNFWDSGSTYLFDESKLAPSGNSPALANSNLITVADNAAGSASFITAKQNIILDVTVGADSSTTGEVRIYRDGGNIYAGVGPNGSTSLQEATASIKLAKNESIYFWNRNPESRNGFMILTATPLVNDVVLLNSQDEIFTDWVSYTPTGDYSSNCTYSGKWRRVGDTMEVQAYLEFSGSPGGSFGVDLPSGYTIDLNKMPRAATDPKNKVGFLQHDRAGSYYVSGTVGINSTSDGVLGYIWAGDGVPVYSTNVVSVGTDDRIYVQFKVPIAGWSSTFNPVLSMPLVDIGADKEYYHLNYFTAAAEYSLYSASTPITNTISSLGTVNNTSAADGGFYFKASTRVKVDFNYWARLSTGSGYNALVKCTEAYWNTGYSFDESYWDNLRLAVVEEETGYVRGVSTSTILEPGEVIGIIRDDTDAPLVSGTPNWASGVSIVVERDRSNTNMAHIIKPAVAVLEDRKAKDTSAGGTTDDVWTARNLNTISGESWFVTGGTFAGTGGTNTTFTLMAGMYYISGNGMGFDCDGFMYRITKSDDTVVYISSTSGEAGSNSSTADNQNCFFSGVITLTSETTLKLESYFKTDSSSPTTTSWGYASFVAEECYSQVIIQKLK